MEVALLGFPTHLVPPVHPFAGPWSERPSAQAAARGDEPGGRRWTLLQLDPQRLAEALLERDYREVGGPFRNEPRLFGLRFGVDGDTRGWAPASVPVRVLARRDAIGP